MEHLVYLVLIIGLACFFVHLHLRLRRDFVAVSDERDAIEIEEKRMFQFLHGLGESLQEDNSPPNMHRYVVNGVVNVVGAEAGILYLLDVERGLLVPVFMTEEPAALIPISSDVLEVTPSKIRRRLRSYLQLTAISRDAGFLGRALDTGKTVFIEDLMECQEFDGPANEFQIGLTVLVAPLVYGQKEVGVLAVTRKDGGFSANDRDVFDSAAEQGAFALGSAIIHAEAHEKRRLEDELKRASEIQRILLPKRAPDLQDYHLVATYRAARILSGDYYDYVGIGDNQYGVAIGDVSGKGIAASLIMAMCRSILRSFAAHGELTPAGVLSEVNRAIFPDIREDMFVSLFYLVLTRDSNEVVLARAGHEPPLLWRHGSNEIETIEPPGIAAGIDDGEVFDRVITDHTVSLNPGDVLLLYTDGVIELMDQSGEEFGFQRLKETLRKGAGAAGGAGGADGVMDSISAAMEAFSGGRIQNDDITLIAIEKH